MAGKSLGTLTLDLVTRLGGFTAGMDKAERESVKRAKAIQKAFDQAGTAIGAAIGFGVAKAIAGVVALDQLTKAAGNFQDIAEEIGGSAEGIASVAVAAATAGVSMESVASASIKLTKNLTGVDDESKAAGAALAALGINLKAFQDLNPEERTDALTKAFAQFADDTGKTAVALDLFGKSGAEQLKVFKALEEQGGRQVILTAAQIKQADDYADAQAKATAELRLYATAAATQAIPALTALTDAGIELLKGLVGVGKESVALAANNGVATFAENAVRSIAFVVDSFRGLQTVISRTGEFLGATAAALVAKLKGDTDGLAAIRAAYNDSLNTDQFVSFRAQVEKNLAAIKNQAKAVGAVADDTRKKLNYGGKEGKAGAVKESRQSEAEKLLETLQKQGEKTLELSVYEQTLLDIQQKRIKGITPALEKQILDQAKIVDQLKAQKEVQDILDDVENERIKTIQRRMEAEQDELDTFFSSGATAKLEKQRDLLMRAAAEVERDPSKANAFSEAATALLDLDKGLDKTKSLTEELGLSFTSAFEDAIVNGGKLSEVLSGLEKDIIRIVTRKLVTEPLGDSLTSLFKGGGSGSSSGGGFLDSIFSKVSGLFSFDGGGYTGSGGRAGGLDGQGGFMAMLHPNETVVDHSKGQRAGGVTINQSFAPGTNRETVNQAAAAASRQLRIADARGN